MHRHEVLAVHALDDNAGVELLAWCKRVVAEFLEPSWEEDAKMIAKAKQLGIEP